MPNLKFLPLAESSTSHLDLKPDRHSFWITDFKSIAPCYRTAQEKGLEWLMAAHLAAEKKKTNDSPHVKALIEKKIRFLFSHYASNTGKIAWRGHELEDFTHTCWNKMRLFGEQLSDISAKMEFFAEATCSLFERFYPLSAHAPDGLVHVTCTGYSAPSAAQQLVSRRGWGRKTEVIHAYHMGCYAAHPALRVATGLTGTAGQSIDIVHTELCSLHMDPSDHDPSSLIIQSLFSDGFIKYRFNSLSPSQRIPATPALQLLHIREEIIPDSLEAMEWTVGPMIHEMKLAKEVPTILGTSLPQFVESLFEEAEILPSQIKQKPVFAIHPGGPRIIELFSDILGLRPEQVSASWGVLQDHGNMSSATLPHIWQRILQDDSIPPGSLIVSLGAGPGLTLSGALFRKGPIST